MNTLRFLLLFLSTPMLLRAQQTKPPTNVPAPASAATATQPTIANPKTPEEFFARARQLSDLEAAGIPFHLKATFVASGDTEFTGNGTYEEWWQSKNLWRTETTLGSYQLASIGKNGNIALYATSQIMPMRVAQAVNFVLIRISDDQRVSNHWKLKHKKIGGIDLVVLTEKNPDVKRIMDPYRDERYYFGHDGTIRIRSIDAITARYGSFQVFQNLYVPRVIDIYTRSSRSLSITVDTLEPLGKDQKTISAISTIPRVPQLVQNGSNSTLLKAQSGAMQSRLLHLIPPLYPPEARKQKLEGTVVLRAIIDEHGKVRELQVTKSAGSLLDAAAVRAVHQWQYRPVIYNGVPVSVDTTISVVFRLR